MSYLFHYPRILSYHNALLLPSYCIFALFTLFSLVILHCTYLFIFIFILNLYFIYIWINICICVRFYINVYSNTYNCIAIDNCIILPISFRS